MGISEQTERSVSFQPGHSFGKFYLVQLIGEGGTSRIFKALQQPINRVVALKIPSFQDAAGVLTPDEFLSEATLMARLDHPGIVRIHDFGVEDGKAFICMEHVEGSNLLELVARHRPLSASAVLSIGIQTLEALMHAHACDVLHQDLSPANVLVSRSGSAKLIDFGMAGKRAVPGTGNVVGTPAFLSPEHVAGEPCTARSDLFSFGSLLYFACRGEPLFDPGEDNRRLHEIFPAIAKARWQPPLDKLRALPSPLSGLVRSALEGGDPASLLREMKELWAQSEGQTRPEEALRREFAETGPGAGEDPATEKEIRETYLRLRSEGRHREAVALLERALRRHPDNPMLRDLLSLPPARAKSAPVTMEVAAVSDAAPNRPRRRTAWTLAAAGALLLCLAAIGLFRAGVTGTQAATAGLVRKEDRTADPAPVRNLEAHADANPAETAATPAPEAVPAESGAPSRGSASPARAQAAPRFSRVSAVAPSPAATARPSGTRPAANPAAGRSGRTKAPALSVAGPAGTRILVNDSLEYTSPAPRGGWPLPTGLVNLVVTLPGEARPISSTLFAASDTLYVLDLEEGGGFSVSRRGR